jgi:hypothetical protein
MFIGLLSDILSALIGGFCFRGFGCLDVYGFGMMLLFFLCSFHLCR